MSEQINAINESIKKITEKDFGIYFFTLDTKGNPLMLKFYTIKMIINLEKMKVGLVLLSG